MKTKRISFAKFMLKVLSLSVEDLLENKVNSSQDAPKFLDIQKINGVPCMYLRYNEGTSKHEWLCLEIPNEPEMPWKKGRNWCQSKGGDYGSIFTLKFISEQREKINQVLEANGYPKIEVGWHWSTEYGSNGSWKLSMNNGGIDDNYKNDYNDVRAVVVS